MEKYTKSRAALSISGILLAASNFVSSVHAEGFTDVLAFSIGLNERFLRNGSFIPIKNLQQVRDGAGRLIRKDVTNLLGSPNDSSTTGLGDGWLYNVNLPLHGEDYLVCQYKVSFYQQVLLSSKWRRPQCNHLFA